MKKIKSIGIFSAILFLISSVVGSGVFLKNNTVFKISEYNHKTVLAGWIFVSILVITLSVLYIKIALKNKNYQGLGDWSESVGGKKFGNFIKFNYSFYYLAICNVTFSIYCAQIIILILKIFFRQKIEELSTYYLISLLTLISGFLLLLVFSFNYFSQKKSLFVIKLFSFLKFIPIFAIIILCFVVYLKDSNKASFNQISDNSRNYQTEINETTQDLVNKNSIESRAIGEFSIFKVFAIIPGILFTFDAFLNVGVLVPRVHKPKKKLPIIFITGLAIVSLIYLSVTISQILIGKSISWSVFDFNNIQYFFGANSSTVANKIFRIIQIIFYSVIFMLILSVLNSFVFTSYQVSKNNIKNNLFCFTKRLNKNYFYLKKPTLFLQILITGFWYLFIFGFLFLSKSDSLVDGISNFPSLYFFLIYCILPIMYWIKNWKQTKVKKIKLLNILYLFFSLIVLLSGIAIISYQVFYKFIYEFIQNYDKDFNDWVPLVIGSKNNEKLSYVYAVIVFGIFLFIFFFFPFLNLYLKNRFKRKLIIKNCNNFHFLKK